MRNTPGQKKCDGRREGPYSSLPNPKPFSVISKQINQSDLQFHPLTSAFTNAFPVLQTYHLPVAAAAAMQRRALKRVGSTAHIDVLLLCKDGKIWPVNQTQQMRLRPARNRKRRSTRRRPRLLLQTRRSQSRTTAMRSAEFCESWALCISCKSSSNRSF